MERQPEGNNMTIEIKMTDEQYEALKMDLADIIWCLVNQQGVQLKAHCLADLIEHAAKEAGFRE
jgi:hypothetical protein